MSIFKDDVLEGKTALITGGGSGICKGIAMRFAGHGANIAIMSRKQHVLDEAAEEIGSATGKTRVGEVWRRIRRCSGRGVGPRALHGDQRVSRLQM